MLAGCVLIAIIVIVFQVNPPKKFKEARDAQRLDDINSISSGVHKYYIDKGRLPLPITSTPKQISNNGVDLCSILTPKYIKIIPLDPSGSFYSGCKSYDTGYTILKINEEVVVSARSEASNSLIRSLK